MSIDPAVPPDTVAAPKPKLLDRLSAACRLRHDSWRTEEASASWIVRFVRLHGLRHPLEMGAAEINAFLTQLGLRPAQTNNKFGPRKDDAT